jgi:hypothetical protein
MSIYWDQKNYTHAFKYKMHQKSPLYVTLSYKYHPVPGCAVHDHPRSEILFDHYVNRPQKSHALYWRTHPQEYKAMFSKIARRKRTVIKL